MMMNPLPSNTSLSQILKYLGSSPKWGYRNRALYAVRQSLRIKDIAVMRVQDIINPDTTIRRLFISPIDYTRYELDDVVRAELHRYLITLYDISGLTLEPLLLTDLSTPLFSTQKRENFSPNTLAQHYSLLDKKLSLHFEKIEVKPVSVERPLKQLPSLSTDIKPKKRPIAQLFQSLANAL